MPKLSRVLWGLALPLIGGLALETTVGQGDQPGHSVPIYKEHSGTFTVAGAIEGAIETRLLLDTGSTYVVLSPDTFKALTRTRSPEKLRLIKGAMADGSVRQAPVYRLSSLTLSPSCTLTDVEAVVFDGATRDILGISALSRLGEMTVAFSPGRLRFAQCGANPRPI